jgi:hypothetical protein
MTSANGTYTDCGDDNFALSFTCTGPSCSGLQGFPLNVTCTNLSSTSIQCSNGITCQNPSNFTSIFSFYQNNLTTSQTQNITTGGKSYILTDKGTPNSTTVAQATSGSTLLSSPRPWPNLLLLIIVFCMMVAQVSAISFQNIVGEFTSGSLGTYLGNHLNGVPYSADTFLQDIVGAMCEGGVVGGTLDLLGGPTKQCVAVLESLTAITVPEAEFAFAFLGSMLCDEIINGLLQGVPGQIENGLCSALESAVGLSPSKSPPPPSPPPSTPPSSPPSSPPPSSPSPPSGSGPSLPDSATLSQDTCVSCLLSGYYIGVTSLAKTCNAVATGTAFDLSTFFCDPSIKQRYSLLCTSLCTNPCGTYNIQTLIQEAGSAYNPSASLALCDADCPGFVGTGMCSGSVPQCECGVGSSTCATLCS